MRQRKQIRTKSFKSFTFRKHIDKATAGIPIGKKTIKHQSSQTLKNQENSHYQDVKEILNTQSAHSKILPLQLSEV